MRCLILETPRDPSTLKLIEQSLPIPGNDQVRIKMTSMGLNRGDLLYCQGRYFFQSPENSRIGFEGAGTIDALGNKLDNSDFKIGDRVALLPMSFDISSQGCFSDYGVYDTKSIIRSPENVSDDETGSFWMAFLTAWGGMVECGGLSQNETVVITAASSSVGIAAIQIAKMQGANVIATSNHESKSQALFDNGADEVIVFPSNLTGEELSKTNENYVNKVRVFTHGKGSDLVFDAVAGPASHGLVKASTQGGRIIIQGMLDCRPMDIHAGVLMKRRLSLRGYTLDETLDNEEKKLRAIDSISKGFNNKQLRSIIAQRHPLSCFDKAFEQLKQNRHIGKILLTP
ncbi:MAG: NADPH:quinone reductase-like Zn-dependent oxidoreductase [Oleiphilaceae bacterium]|jgi:NADPH:quinone reductase-like Zn-dependent oxidoreductase